MEEKKEKRNMRKYSFEEIALLDQALFNLASYDVTGGLMVIVESPEEAHKLRDKIINRFNYFKQLIQRGSCSFDYIRNTVLDANGPFYHPKHKDIDTMLNDPEFCKESDDELMDKTNNLLRNIFLSQCFPENNENKH
jgi:hypothetical protein